MYLTLIIDGHDRQSWYLDDDKALRKYRGLTFEENAKKHKKVIDDKVLDIKQDYWQDIAGCEKWEIVMSVKSKMNTMEEVFD